MPIATPAQPGSSSPYAGRTIARCKVAERLGRGATSHVFRAFYEPLNKDIALKILATEAAGSQEMRRRFLSEARAVAKLNHENIVKVLDVVEDHGLLCILMELVNGPTLQDRLDDDTVIPPRHAFRIAAQIARALESAHEQKVVHRDVKPANVILTGRPGDETVKVVDFGLAAQQEMNRVGTPLFMSPEAAQGKRIDEKSDVYALGVCLYRMLTGVLPFTGATVKDILAAQVNAEMVPPSERRPQLGTAYDDLLKKLLVKSKGYRPSAGDAADTLEELADDLEERDVGVRRVRKKRRLARKKSKPVNPAVWAVLAVVGIIVVIAAMVMSGGKPPTPPTAGGSTPTPPVAVDRAKEAFDKVDTWFATSPANPAEAVRRWGAVEQQFPGTTWATKAGIQRVAAEARLAEKKQADEEAAAKRPPAPVTTDSKPNYSRLEELVKNFDFGDASAAIDNMDDPPTGTSSTEWDHRGSRLQFLAKNFNNVMDAGITARSKRVAIKAKDMFPNDAKDGETIVGANSGGAVVTDSTGSRHTVPWSRATPDKFVKSRGVIKDTVLDTNDFTNLVVLACIAAEFNQPEALTKLLKDVRAAAGEKDDKVDRTVLVRSLFGD